MSAAFCRLSNPKILSLKKEMKIRVIFEESRMINVTINTTITFITTIGI